VQVPTKATHQQTREFNERLILRTLYDYGPISRAEIARRTHLTRTTVSDVISALFERGMVEEVGRGPSSGGKAPILLRLVGDAREVIGLDLGETEFVGGLVNLRGKVKHQARLPVAGRNGEQALDTVYQLVDLLVPEAGGRLLGIGVGTPGVIDSYSGAIRWAVNLDWQDLPLGTLLSERYVLPVTLANDSQAAALAEYAFAAEGPRPANLVAIKVGRGIGAGLLLAGELFQGDASGAGEIGHYGVVDGGDECHCGRYGCLETVASGRAIVKQAAELAAEHPESLLNPKRHGKDRLTLDDVVEAFEEGDELARSVVLKAGRYLGQVIAAIIGVLDVQQIVLHGSVTAFGEPWLEAVRDEARRRALTLLSSNVDIRITTIGTDLTVLGASAMVMSSELGLSLAR
jgi:predicted NBD/HSP70 family sugar kinase